MEISNHTFLVTGGASGLGGATTAALLERGAHVTVLNRTEARAEALVREQFAHVLRPLW